MNLTGADFEAVFLSVLQGNAALKALVGDRVFALIIPDGTYLPCVTFQRISGTPANTLGDAPASRRSRCRSTSGRGLTQRPRP